MKERFSLLLAKNFSGSSDNKIHRSHDSASRYLKLCLILAVEERHQIDIWGACRQRLGAYAFPPCPTCHPNLALGRPTLEKQLFMAHSNPCFPWSCWIWSHLPEGKKKKKKTQKKRWQFQRCVHLPMWGLNWIHMGTGLRPIIFHFYLVEQFPVIITEVKAR